MERIGITGAGGFIGNHLTERLKGFTSIPHDKIQSHDFGRYSKVFFLSTYGNMPEHSQGSEGAILKANVEDLVHVVRQINYGKLESLVFLSTSSVKLPIQTMYSRTKRAAEEILLAVTERYNAPITIIRPYSVTGVGEQSQHLIPKLIRSCLDGTPMEFVAEPVHDFIDVEDLVDGIMFLSDRKARGVYDLGSGEGISNELVKELVEEVTGKKANVRTVRSMRAYDTLDWVSKNMRARDMGWMPKKTLRQSIEEMVEAYEQA